jgi:hypothetical protein
MPTVQINRKLEPLLTKHKPIKIALGGRGSGKSIGIGDIMTVKMATERADIYCLREFQDSIQDYQNNHWFLYRIPDDSNTPIHENCLVNGKLTLYFNITNIKFYINESVPYVNENVKHVFINQ